MKRILIFGIILFSLGVAGCGQAAEPVETATAAPTTPPTTLPPTQPQSEGATAVSPAATLPTVVSGEVDSPPQFGLNFIRFYWENNNAAGAGQTPDYLLPDFIFGDFADLGVDAYRQFIKADLFWDIVEPQNDQWNFTAADSVIMADSGAEPIVTLFSLQYASPTPPWAQPGQFQKEVGPEAADYLTTVVQRYAPYVTYWEIGNEMDHWRAFDPGGGDNMPPPQRSPAAVPEDGFSPQEQGVFLAQVAEIIRANDPDAVILLPGMGGLDDYTLNTWLAGVLEGGGADWFDVVNYHYYGPWYRFPFDRQRLDDFLAANGLTGKPVWLTETGATNDPTLNGRTDYPNSPEEQAADVFRRTVQAWGLGDSFVAWHTYISSPATPNNLWRGYGIRSDQGVPQLSYFAVQLLTSELLPYAQVDALQAEGQNGVNLYRITRQDGAVKYVAWGQGSLPIPDGVTQMTSVVPRDDLTYGWDMAVSGQTTTLSSIPILFR